MQSRHVVAGAIGVGEFGDNLLERERAGINDFRVGRAQGQQVVGHDRTRVKARFALFEQVLTADGDQVGSARARADEINRHLVTVHWVTGWRGRQPVKAPNGSP